MGIFPVHCSRIWPGRVSKDSGAAVYDSIIKHGETALPFHLAEKRRHPDACAGENWPCCSLALQIYRSKGFKFVAGIEEGVAVVIGEMSEAGERQHK